MNIRYFFGAMISLPLLPLMFYQGHKVRSNVPRLPEAAGTKGYCRPRQTRERPFKVIGIGESSMAGVGVATHQEGFTGVFAGELSKLFHRGVSWKVYARSGYTARRVERLIVPSIEEQSADLIVIGLGGNDAFELNRPSRWKSDIRSLISSLKSKFPDAIVVFINMPPIREFPAFPPLIKYTLGNLVEILGQELSAVVDEYKDVYYCSERIDLNSWMERFELDVDKEDFFCDGVHPSRLTYQIWAQLVAHELYDDEGLKESLLARI